MDYGQSSSHLPSNNLQEHAEILQPVDGSLSLRPEHLAVSYRNQPQPLMPDLQLRSGLERPSQVVDESLASRISSIDLSADRNVGCVRSASDAHMPLCLPPGVGGSAVGSVSEPCSLNSFGTLERSFAEKQSTPVLPPTTLYGMSQPTSSGWVEKPKSSPVDISCGDKSITTGATPSHVGDVSNVSSGRLLDTRSSSNDIECDEETIKDNDYPFDLKEPQYDAVIIYTMEDHDIAEIFASILTECIVLENGKPPMVCTLESSLQHYNSRFKHLGEALKRSTYMFMLVTEKFCTDSWAEVQRDECLMESIEKPDKRWCVIPILTQSRTESTVQLPFGLRALKGVNIAHILNGQSLEEVRSKHIVPSTENVDPYFQRNMKRMLNDRINMKLEREKEQKKEREKWAIVERERRRHQREKERIEKMMHERQVEEQRARHKAEEELFKQQMEQNLKAGSYPRPDMFQNPYHMPPMFPYGMTPPGMPYDPRYFHPLPASGYPSYPYHPGYGPPVYPPGPMQVHHHYLPASGETAPQKVFNITGPVYNAQFGDHDVMNSPQANVTAQSAPVSVPAVVDTVRSDGDLRFESMRSFDSSVSYEVTVDRVQSAGQQDPRTMSANSSSLPAGARNTMDPYITMPYSTTQPNEKRLANVAPDYSSMNPANMSTRAPDRSVTVAAVQATSYPQHLPYHHQQRPCQNVDTAADMYAASFMPQQVNLPPSQAAVVAGVSRIGSSAFADGNNTCPKTVRTEHVQQVRPFSGQQQQQHQQQHSVAVVGPFVSSRPTGGTGDCDTDPKTVVSENDDDTDPKTVADDDDTEVKKIGN